MKWYHLTTHDRALRDDLQALCKLEGIQYEIHKAEPGWRIAMLLDKYQRRRIDRWLLTAVSLDR